MGLNFSCICGLKLQTSAQKDTWIQHFDSPCWLQCWLHIKNLSFLHIVICLHLFFCVGMPGEQWCRATQKTAAVRPQRPPGEQQRTRGKTFSGYPVAVFPSLSFIYPEVVCTGYIVVYVCVHPYGYVCACMCVCVCDHLSK